MTKRALFGRYAALLFCYCSGLLYLAFQGGKVAGMIFAMMNVLVLYLLMGRWSGIRKPQISRRLSTGRSADELEAGTPLSVRLSVKISGFWPHPYIIVKDRLKRNSGNQMEFETAFVPDWKGQGEIEYQTSPLERGIYTFEQTTCTTEDVFGLFQHSGTVSVSHKIHVWPRTVTIRHWRDFNLLAKGGKHHTVSGRASRESTQINGVRDYVYGDRISRIHWNASARTGEWKSKEFERESMPTIVVVIDAQQTAYESSASFELAVSTAASFIKFARQQGLSCGLLTTQRDPVYFPPDNDGRSIQQMMLHLVTMQCDGRKSIDSILEKTSWNEERPVVILITPVRRAQLTSVFKKLKTEQSVVCHMWIRSSREQPTSFNDLKESGAYHTKTYAIHSLEQLSASLGGKRS